MTAKLPADRNRAFRLAGALLGVAVALGACKHVNEEVTASFPEDYRQRHPIAIQEADRSIVVFVGHGRGGLSAQQRADVIGLAQTWLGEGTGAIRVDVPVNTPNARTAADAYREIQATLAAAGVPPRAIVSRQYPPADQRTLADDPAELLEDCRGRRTLRPVAGGPRALHPQQELHRKQVLLQFRLRQSAQPGGDGRQSVRSGAAAARNAGLYRTTHRVL